MSPAAAITTPVLGAGLDGEGLGVGDGIGERLGLGEGDGEALGWNVMTSCGRLVASRLARLVAVTLVVVRATLMGSLPRTIDVTFHSSHVFDVIGPEESTTA